MQLLLNAHGPRVDCGKRQGLFRKTATVDHYLVPLTSARSDLRRSLLIQWLSERGAWPRWRKSPETKLRGGARLDFAGVHQIRRSRGQIDPVLGLG